MAQNNHKTKRRIISILCVSIIVLYALVINVSATEDDILGNWVINDTIDTSTAFTWEYLMDNNYPVSYYTIYHVDATEVVGDYGLVEAGALELSSNGLTVTDNPMMRYDNNQNIYTTNSVQMIGSTADITTTVNKGDANYELSRTIVITGAVSAEFESWVLANCHRQVEAPYYAGLMDALSNTTSWIVDSLKASASIFYDVETSQVTIYGFIILLALGICVPFLIIKLISNLLTFRG